MHPERFESWLTVDHPRALLPARRIPHRPAWRGEARGHHARPFRSRPAGPRPCACHARDARADEDAARHRGEARHADACLWRDVAGRRRDGEARACGTRARQRAGGDRVAGTPRRRSRATTSEAPTRPVLPSSSSLAISSSPRRPSRCRCSSHGDARGRSGEAAQIAGAVSRARACGRRLRPRQMPAPHRAAARGGLRGADLSARRARRLLRAL